MEKITIDSAIIAVPKDKYFPKKDLEFHLKILGCWNSICVNLAQKIFGKHEKSTVIEIGGVGVYSILALKQGHEVKIIETNPVFKKAFIESIALNTLQESTHEHLQLHISNEFLMKGKRCTPLKDIIGKGCLFLKLSPSLNSMEYDMLESARPLLAEGKVSFIMFDLNYMNSNKRLEKTSVIAIRTLIEEGYVIYEFDEDFKLIEDFDKHLASKLDNIDANLSSRLILAVHKTKMGIMTS